MGIAKYKDTMLHTHQHVLLNVIKFCLLKKKVHSCSHHTHTVEMESEKSMS